jgi:hypothetical protein
MFAVYVGIFWYVRIIKVNFLSLSKEYYFVVRKKIN